MVFNATFNNISVISWWLALLVEETRIPGENHRAQRHLSKMNLLGINYCVYKDFLHTDFLNSSVYKGFQFIQGQA
jgi:hypothetical protein